METIGRLLAIQSSANSRNGGNPTSSSKELGLDDEVLITDCLLKSISPVPSRAWPIDYQRIYAFVGQCQRSAQNIPFPRWRKFSELMTDHFIRNIYRNIIHPIMY